MIALDTDVLACAVNRFAPEHARALAVVETLANGDRPWALPWVVVHDFLALVTHPHAVARPLRPLDAWTFLEALNASPSLHPLGPTERHGSALAEVLALAAAEGGGIPPALELAAVLREHGVREVLSGDRALRRYPFLVVRDPLHGPVWSPEERPARRYRVLAPRARRPAGA